MDFQSQWHKNSYFDHIRNNDSIQIDLARHGKGSIEYSECDTELVTCQIVSIAELTETSSDESDDEKYCAVVESVPSFNES